MKFLKWLKKEWYMILFCIIFCLGLYGFTEAIRAAEISVTVNGCFISSVRIEEPEPIDTEKLEWELAVEKLIERLKKEKPEFFEPERIKK